MISQLTKIRKLVNLLWISTKTGQIVVQKSGKVGVFHPSFLWKEKASLWKVKMGFLKSGKLSI